jgi:hypothetical protein
MPSDPEDQITEFDEKTGVTTIRRAGNVPIYCKVIGVTKNNPDLTNRQDIIRTYARRGMLAQLEHDKLDMDSRIAVAVFIDTPNGRQQVGFLPTKISQEISDDLDHGIPWYAAILRVTGGTPDKPTTGLSLGLSKDEIKITLVDNNQPTSKPRSKAANLLIFAAVILVLFFLWVAIQSAH